MKQNKERTTFFSLESLQNPCWNALCNLVLEGLKGFTEENVSAFIQKKKLWVLDTLKSEIF